MKHFARKDSKTGKGINSGFCFGDGDAYFKKKKHARKYAKKIGYSGLKEAHEDEAYYWTEWEVDYEDEYYDANGNTYTKCHRCKEETLVIESHRFCTHCLTHL